MTVTQPAPRGLFNAKQQQESDMEMENTSVTIGASQLDPETFEAACAAGLSVCTSAASTFNRQVARFATNVRAPLLSRIEVLSDSIRSLMLEVYGLKFERNTLRQELQRVRAEYAAPPCPPGCIEYTYCAGTSTGAERSTTLVCHLEYSAALPKTEADPAEPARVVLIAAYHHGVNVLDTLVSKGNEISIEEQALAEVQS